MVQIKALPVVLCVMAKNCYFSKENKRIVMSVYNKNTSLTITAVNVSDTGLYYCGYGKIKHMKHTEEKETGSDSPAVFFMTVGFSALTVILLGVLIFILKQRKNSL
ncbi:Ig kappa chain V19-17-like, partial [Clarias magur]